MELRIENGFNNGWVFDRMNSFFKDQYVAPTRHLLPPTDVVEDKDAYHFYFEMPGLKSESLDVKVEDDRLLVAAERKRPELPEHAEMHLAERSYGWFRRAFQLPKDASHDHIQASYKDGVLDVTIEKRPESKPVKIQIN